MKYIKTTLHKGAGVGHKWMNWQLGAILSEKWGYKFIHSSLDSDRSGGTWDKFLGFGDGYVKTDMVSHLNRINIPKWDYGFNKTEEVGRKNIKQLYDFLENGADETIYVFPYNHFQGIVAEYLPLIIPSLRGKYYTRQFNPIQNTFVVSLHLRRGDINPIHNKNRWLDNDFYIKWIDRIKTILDKRNINSKFVLFSTTGNSSIFDGFQPFVELRIDGDPFEDFNYMVYSDILFAGLSSYSILAATLNRNFCFYCPLRNFTDWMESSKSPYKDRYSNAFNEKVDKLKQWL